MICGFARAPARALAREAMENFCNSDDAVDRRRSFGEPSELLPAPLSHRKANRPSRCAA